MLLDTLNKLRKKGNTIVVVEHDEDTINSAEHVIDIGPGAGVRGGEVITHCPTRSTARVKKLKALYRYKMPRCIILKKYL